MAKIYVKLDTLISQSSKLKTAGQDLISKDLAINGEDMSGMKGGQEIVACAKDINRLMNLFHQLITKNCKQIQQMGNDFNELDQNLSK